MIYPSVVKNFNVYKNAATLPFLGVGDITLPDIKNVTDALKGGGLGGSFDLPVGGQVAAMMTTISFHTTTPDSISLMQPNGTQIVCRSSLEMVDTAVGIFREYPERIIMTVFSRGLNLGKRDTSSKGASSNEFAVTYLACYWNNAKLLEIDPFNNVYSVNGTDYNAATRANI